MAFLGLGSGGPDFRPGQVAFGPQSNLTMPYMRNKPVSMNGLPGMLSKNPTGPDENVGPRSDTTPPANSSNVLGAESVRATGSGPFDPTYRQNLATFAGGQFARPGGSLSFDPTGSLFGNPTGGGNAPVQGMPDSLIGQALSGNPFSFTPPQPAPDQMSDPLKWWRDQFSDNGAMFGGRVRMME